MQSHYHSIILFMASVRHAAYCPTSTISSAWQYCCRSSSSSQSPASPGSGTGTDWAAMAGRRWRCREVGSWERAQQLLREGHTYLDGDGDGEACEALR